MNQEHSQIQLLDPSTLRLHPELQAIAQYGWSDEDPRFLNLCDSVEEHGVRDPIKITPSLRIADGSHRWRATKCMQLPLIPCIEIPEEDVLDTILISETQRKHRTEDQLAYIWQPTMDIAFEEGKQRRMKNLIQNQSLDFCKKGPSTVEQFATKLGVSKHRLEQARKVRQLFEQHPEQKAHFEPKIMDATNPMLLAHVIQGIAGSVSTKGEKMAIVPNRQFDLFNEGAETFGKRFSYWSEFDDRQKREAIATVATAIAGMPDDALTETYTRIKAEITRRKSAVQ